MKYKFAPVNNPFVGQCIQTKRNYLSFSSGMHWKIDEVGYDEIIAHVMGEPNKKSSISRNDMQRFFQMVVVDNS